jgi:hypothetical protein
MFCGGATLITGLRPGRSRAGVVVAEMDGSMSMDMTTSSNQPTARRVRGTRPAPTGDARPVNESVVEGADPIGVEGTVPNNPGTVPVLFGATAEPAEAAEPTEAIAALLKVYGAEIEAIKNAVTEDVRNAHLSELSYRFALAGRSAAEFDEVLRRSGLPGVEGLE